MKALELTKSTIQALQSGRCLIFVCLFFALLCAGCSGGQKDAAPYVPDSYLREGTPIAFDRSSLNAIPDNSFPTLSVPTYITKIKDNYFIVDCYNNQVIYSKSLTDPLYEWQVMTRDVSMAHTIAGDGLVYLIDDTENHRILVMEEDANDNGQPIFVPTQEFTQVGVRPHYIVYDSKTDTFYAWSSESGEMFLFRHPENDPHMYLTEVRSIPSLNGVYVRSFTIMDDGIYFVSGHNNQKILKAQIVENNKEISFKITDRYEVPTDIAGMVQLYKIQDYYYITVSTDNTENQDYATIIRTKDLDLLKTGDYEDIYADFGLSGGTPYYINEIEGRYYMTHHRTDKNIIAFDVIDNKIENAAPIY